MPSPTLRLVINSHPIPAPAVEAGFWSRLAGTVECWMHRIEQRRDLARLSPHQLRDIGLNFATAREEVEKPFWRA